MPAVNPGRTLEAVEEILLAQIEALAQAREALADTEATPELDELRELLAEEEALRVGLVGELIGKRWLPP